MQMLSYTIRMPLELHEQARFYKLNVSAISRAAIAAAIAQKEKTLSQTDIDKQTGRMEP